MAKASERADAYLKSRGYDPNGGVNTGGGVRNYNVAKAAPASNFIGNLGKSIGGIPRALGGVATSIVKPFADIARFGERTLSSRQNAWVASKIVSEQQKLRDKNLADFKSGKISAQEFSKRVNAVEKTKGAETLKKINKKGEADTKEFTNKKVLTDYAKVAATTLSVAAPFATATTAVAPGANVLARGANYAQRGLDFGFGAGNMLKPGAGIGKGLMKTAGIGLDVASNNSFIDQAAQGKLSGVDAALTGSAFVPGGPLGIASKALGKGGEALSKALYSKQGVFDKIAIKGGTILSEAEKIADPKLRKKTEDTLKQFQDFLLQQHGTPKRAAAAFTDYVAEHKNLSLDEVVSEMSTFKSAATKADKIAARAKAAKQEITVAGKVIDPAKGQIRVGKSNYKDIAGARSIARRSASPEEAVATIRKEFPELASNKRNAAILDEIIDKKLTATQADELLKAKFIGTNPIMIDGKPMTFPGGYYAFYTPKDYAKFKKVADTGPLLKSKSAPLAPIGDLLEKAGISTQSANPQEQKSMFKKVRDTFNSKVDTMGVQANGEVLSGQKVFNKLNDELNQKIGATDIRQLKWKEVQEALGSNEADAKAVLKAYKDSFSVLTTAERGFGGKIMDINLSKNPLAAPYSRAQSVFRYEKNPFFRAQENIETKLGVAAFTGTNAKAGRDYTETIDALKDTGVFRGGGYGSEGAAEFANITAKLSRSQKRNIAAGIESLAGSTDPAAIKAWLKKNPDMVENLRAVVQYPDRGLTSSNLMKTLNLVAFPVRYNVKVTQMAAKALAKEHGVRQLAVLGGFKNFQEWQKTPEGIKWNSDNAELLGIMRYFTPIGSIETIYKTLTEPLSERTVRDIGTIGGLPFGLISGVLQGQGVVQLDSPYLDPKTGEVVPSKIPKDTKARLSQALADIIGTMYTFPGRQINAPSKKSMNEKLAETVSLGTLKGGKFESVTRTDLTPGQKKTQAVLRAGKGTPGLKSPNSSAPLKPLSGTPMSQIVKPKFKASKAKAKRIARPINR